MADEPIDETDEADTRPALEQIIEELKSGYGGIAGPVKEVNELKLEGATPDGANNKITARIVIGSFRQGLYDDMWHEEKPFDITLDDARYLEKAAPSFRPVFAKIAERLSAQLQEAREEYVSGVENWCNAGLPVQKKIAVFKPLRLKGKQRI